MLNIDTARVFEPLTKPSRYKGAWGGRGSGKSHFMAGQVVEHCLLNPGSRIMSSTLLGPLLPPYVAMPVQVMCAARGDCSPRGLYDH
jgi:hypothetical protein